MKNKPWTDDENIIVVNAYFELKKLLDRGNINITKFINNITDQNNLNRSKRAVESKFQNISAILIKKELSFLENFKPYTNFQKSLEKIVEDYLNQHDYQN